MSEPSAYVIVPTREGTYTLSFPGGILTGFPTHEAAARWVMEYTLRLFSIYQRAEVARRWASGGAP